MGNYSPVMFPKVFYSKFCTFLRYKEVKKRNLYLLESKISLFWFLQEHHYAMIEYLGLFLVFSNPIMVSHSFNYTYRFPLSFLIHLRIIIFSDPPYNLDKKKYTEIINQVFKNKYLKKNIKHYQIYQNVSNNCEKNY